MNERIRELAEQAAQEVRVEHNNPYWRMQNEIKEDSDWREKFAELIVQECAQVCRDQPTEYALPLDRENCASAIEEHFGVE